METCRTELFNSALLRSLSIIQAAKTQFNLLTASNMTSTVLVSQIKLCDVLLREVRAIRCSLAGRMRYRGVVRPRSVVARRNSSSRYLNPHRKTCRQSLLKWTN
jgi:hypothetical protein